MARQGGEEALGGSRPELEFRQLGAGAQEVDPFVQDPLVAASGVFGAKLRAGNGDRTLPVVLARFGEQRNSFTRHGARVGAVAEAPVWRRSDASCREARICASRSGTPALRTL